MMNFTIRPKERIVSSSEGFAAVRGQADEVFRVNWNDVREIVTFKRDLLTTDCVCLGFRTADGDSYFEVNEEIDGFILLTDEMIRRFPTIDPVWFGHVTQPAFATNWTRLHGEGSVV